MTASKKADKRPKVAVVANREKLEAGPASALRANLCQAGLDPTWIEIEKGSAAKKATAKAVDRGATHIVVAGGDGTVRAAASALVGTKIPLSVVPAGTANLFHSAMSLPESVEDIVASVVQGDDHRIDVGRCNGQVFTLMAGTGFDARMLDGAEDAKAKQGRLAYITSAARAARDSEPFKAKVKINGIRVFEGEATCVLVANIGQVMGGLEAIPEASPEDGMLNVSIVTAEGLDQWGSLLWHAIRRDQASSGLVQLGAGTKVKVRLTGKRTFELDGGTKGTTDRLDVEVVPHGLVVRRPLRARTDHQPVG